MKKLSLESQCPIFNCLPAGNRASRSLTMSTILPLIARSHGSSLASQVGRCAEIPHNMAKGHLRCHTAEAFVDLQLVEICG